MPVIMAVDKRLHNVYSHHPQHPHPFNPPHGNIFRNGQCKFAADAVIAAHYGQANVAIAIAICQLAGKTGNMARTGLIRQMQSHLPRPLGTIPPPVALAFNAIFTFRPRKRGAGP